MSVRGLSSKVCAASAKGQSVPSLKDVVAYSGAKPRGNAQVEMARDAVPYVVSAVGIACAFNPAAKDLVGRVVATTAVTAWAFYSAACVLTCAATIVGKGCDLATGKNSSSSNFKDSDAFVQEGGVFTSQ